MKQTFFLLLVFSLTVFACDEPIPHIVFNTIDSIPPVDTITGDNYDGKTPVVDELVIDYTTPDPYQHVPQLFLDSTLSSSWDDAGFPNAKDFQAFYQTFQWDVMDRNKEKISALILYPLPGYKDNKAFLRNFDSIFSPDFVEAIVQQKPEEIYRNKYGAMAGEDGQVWFRLIKGRYRIVKINP
jgi:hypothetical protein